MPFTDDELEALYGGLGDSHVDYSQPAVTSQPAAENTPVSFKLGRQIANILPQTANILTGDISRLASYVDPAVAQNPLNNPVPTFDVGQNTGIKDTILNQAVPEIVSWMIPYEGELKAAKVLGGVAKFGELPLAARIGTEALAQGSANFISAPNQQDAMQQGVMGAVSGALQQGLPRLARLPFLAAASYAGTGGDPHGTVLNTGFNMIPGFHGDIPSVTAPPLIDRGFQSIADAITPYAPWIPSAEDFNKQTPAHVQYSPEELSSDISQQAIPSSSPTSANQAIGLTSDASLYDRGTPYGDAFANLKPPQLEDINSKYNLIDAPELSGVEEKPLVPIAETPSEKVLSSFVETPVVDRVKAAYDKLKTGGFPDVSISDVMKEASVTIVSEGHAALDELRANGEVNLSGGDASLSDKQTKKWGYQLKGSGDERPYLMMRVEPPVETHPVEVMNPQGDLVAPKPTQDGPHIISTVLDEGDGNFLGGDKWNSPHMKGEGNIFSSHAEVASGEGKSAFLVKDEAGQIRVTQDRLEAAKIAEAAGQRKPETIGQGPLQSEDLQEPQAQAQARVEDPLQKEKVQDHAILSSVVEDQLRENLAKAVDPIEKRIAGRKLREFLETNHPDKLEELQAKAAKLVGSSEGDPRMATEGKDSIARWQARYKNQGGFLNIPDEAKVSFLTGGISGLVAYQQSKHDVGTTLAASLVGAGLGLVGVKAIQRLKAIKGPEVKVTKIKVAGEKVAEKLAQFVKDTSKNAAGLAVGGRGGLFPASMQLARNLLSLNRLPGFDDAKLLADGFIDVQVTRLVESLKQVRNIQPSTAMSESVARFIRGQLADPQEVKPILDAGGITGASYNSLDKVGRALYPDKWMYLDDPKNTNTKGDGVEVWHVTNDVKQQLVQLQYDKLDTLAISPADKAYAEFAKTFRNVTDNMMQVYHDALPDGEIKNRMTGTMGQYIVRSHAVITDPSVYPTEVVIQNAMDKLGLQKEREFFSSVGAIETPSGTNNTAVSSVGNTYYVPPDKALDFQFLHSPESLHGEVRDYIAEIKQIGALQGKTKIETGSENFAGDLFTGRKDLDTIAQALLETHNTPLEMMQATTNKIVRAAQVGHFMQDAVKVLNPESGTASAMSGTEYNKAIQDLKKVIENPTLHDSRIVRDANNKYQELTTYSLTPKNARFGLAEGQYISQGLKTAIRGFDGTPFGFLDNNIGRGLHWFNGYFKTTHLALSPASISRQIFQAPFMMAMGGVRDAESIMNGFRGYKDRSTVMGKWMTENGVFASSQAHGDFNSSVEQIVNGQFEQGAWGQIKRGVAGAHKLFAAPDDIVRASVFMAEAKRAAAKLGVPLDSFDPRVAEQARNFMLRRAINFANLPLYVKLGREIPFVNIFLAYTHEIARVSKNMAMDASKGDLQAGATLAGMAALPFILQRQFESQLPTEEKKSWDVAKNLVPSYSRMRFKLPLKKEVNGSFSYLDITSVLPFNDYQMMARAVLRGDKEAFADVNPVLGLDKSPFFSVMTPQITGENEHTGRKFRGAGDRLQDILGQLLPAWTPGVGFEYQKSAPEELGGQLGVTNLKNGKTNTGIGAFLRNFTGIDFTQLNPDVVTRNTVSAAKEQIANEKQYLYGVLKSTISDSAKQRATEKFVESVQHITLDMQSKLQLNGHN